MLKTLIRPKFLMAFLLMIFGIILVSHVKSVNSSATTVNLAQRYKQRQIDLNNAEEQYQVLLAESDRLSKQKADLQAEQLKQQGYDTLLAELQMIRILAGFTEVRGPGVILTLNDKPNYDVVMDPAESIVHDGDIRHAIYLFKAAGAGGFAINGLRYANSSYINCIGPAILCNQQRMTPPYVIVALGDPKSLAEVIRNDLEFLIRQQPGIGLQVKIEELDEVVLPPFADADHFDQYIDLLEVANP